MVYILLFVLIFSPYVFSLNRNKNTETTINCREKRFNYKYTKLYFLVISSFMIFLLTFRHDFVGTDTQNYRWLYEAFGNMSFEMAFQHIKDVGFIFFFQSASKLGFSFRSVLFLQSLFYISAITYIIKKYSKIPALSYWFFITMGYFIFSTTMRQAIAMSITLLSYDLIKRKKMWSFILCIIIASLFHLTAIVFLPAYWIDKFKYNRKTLLLIISIIAIVFIFREKISIFMLSYANSAYTSTNTGGYFLILFLVGLLALGIIYKMRFLIDGNNKLLFFMIAGALALLPIAKVNPAVFRIANYYQVFIILYIPNLIACIEDKMMKFILTYFFLILGAYYFYFKLASYGIRMHPYVFWCQDYPIKIPGLN